MSHRTACEIKSSIYSEVIMRSASLTVLHIFLFSLWVNAQSVVDYRNYQSPVRDQQRRMTCTAFAITAALETFPGFPSDLSEQYIYAMIKSDPDYYSQIENYQDGGFLFLYIQAMQQWGTVREDQEPYNPEAIIWDGVVTNFDKMKRDLGGTRLYDLLQIEPFCYTVYPKMYTYCEDLEAKNVDQIKTWLDNGARCIPVSYYINSRYWIGHPASRQHKINPADFLIVYDGEKSYDLGIAKMMFLGNFYDYIYQRKVDLFYKDSTLAIDGGHAVSIVGYDEDGFLIKNSWGTRWGQEGYGWISFDYHRLYAAETMHMPMGQVQIKNYVADEPETGQVNPENIWLKSLPHESELPLFNMHTKGISISVIYHGNTQIPRFSGIEYKTYDAQGHLTGTWYGNTRGIFDGKGSGYNTYILSEQRSEFPSASRMTATFTTLSGQTFTNTYYHITARNQEYAPSH